jgi:hypothetical protein
MAVSDKGGSTIPKMPNVHREMIIISLEHAMFRSMGDLQDPKMEVR